MQSFFRKCGSEKSLFLWWLGCCVNNRLIPASAVTILKSRSKIAIFCQNRPKSKLLHLLSHVSISSCVDFLQQLMDVTGLKDYNFLRFQTEYCVYTKHGLKIE